jgi:glycosyltransferase involved in cell wall biosynthesis
VVPLLPGLRRSAGQQTYLNGMVLGKPVVVSDVPGAREHVVDGETGLLVPPGDAAALAEALRWVLDPANADAVARMGARAREAVLTEAAPDRYVERLLDVVDGLPA